MNILKDVAKPVVVGALSGTVFVAASAIAFWGAKNAGTAALVMGSTMAATGYVGYRGEPGSWQRGLLYGAAAVPFAIVAITAADAVDSALPSFGAEAKRRHNKLKLAAQRL